MLCTPPASLQERFSEYSGCSPPSDPQDVPMQLGSRAISPPWDIGREMRRRFPVPGLILVSDLSNQPPSGFLGSIVNGFLS